MRLSIDASSISPGRSAGIETFTYGLLDGLVDDGGHQLSVDILSGTRQQWRTRVPASDVRWTEIDLPLRSDTPIGNRLRRYVPEQLRSSVLARRVVDGIRDRARPAPLVEADATVYPFSCVPAKAPNAVIVLHDLRRFQPEFLQPGYVAVVRENVARAAAVAVSWPHPYEQVLRTFPEARDKTVLIPPPTFNARPPGLPNVPESDLLLYPSSTAPHKNHSTLLHAMTLLSEFRLVCPGPLVEPQAAALRARAARPDLAGRVELPGFLPTHGLEELYARASIVVVPSTWEAASGAIFEAFSWGLPVVCADVEPLRAQVAFAGAEVGFFDPYDPTALARAVRLVAAQRDHYAAASLQASRRLAGRTWTDTARDYADVCAWAAGGSQGPIPRSKFAEDLTIGQEP